MWIETPAAPEGHDERVDDALRPARAHDRSRRPRTPAATSSPAPSTDPSSRLLVLEIAGQVAERLKKCGSSSWVHFDREALLKKEPASLSSRVVEADRIGHRDSYVDVGVSEHVPNEVGVGGHKESVDGDRDLPDPRYRRRGKSISNRSK